MDSQLSRINCQTVLDRVEFGASGRKRQHGDVVGHNQFRRIMPPCLIEQQNGVCARCDMEGDFLKMHVHRLAVAAGHDDTGALPSTNGRSRRNRTFPVAALTGRKVPRCGVPLPAAGDQHTPNAFGDGTFAKGRDFAAWLGLTPLQHSTGGKPRLGSISKMGRGHLPQRGCDHTADRRHPHGTERRMGRPAGALHVA